MEAPGYRRRQLPVLLLCVNGVMTLGFTGACQRTNVCNESLMLEKLPACGKFFEDMMKKVDSKKWCNLTEFIIHKVSVKLMQRHSFSLNETTLEQSLKGTQVQTAVDVKPRVVICSYFRGHQNVCPKYYDNFTQCTEHEAKNASCFWPNPLTEGFITGIHKQFFSNCTSEKVHWEDPPDEILITLILIPVMLTCAMITLVVWCSKRSDILV